MAKWLISFLNYFLLILKDESATSVTIMNAMDSDTNSDLDQAVPEIWQRRFRVDSARKSFWGKFFGAEMSEKPIIERTDFVNQAGDIIRIQVMSELYGPGVTGESTLRGSEDKLSLGQFTLTVDWLRKAISITKKVKKEVNFDTNVQIRQGLTRWWARERDAKVFGALLDDVTPNTLYSGDAVSSATISENDAFSTTQIDKIALELNAQGALPLSVSRNNGEETNHYGIVISDVDAYNLRGDQAWLQANREGHLRGEKNPIFSGAMGEWNGVLIYTLTGIRGAGCVQGTPLRPECKLSADITAVTTTITVGTAYSNEGQQKEYTKFFASSGTITIGTEEITYSAKTYNAFTVTSRGANGTTAAAHSSGAYITQRNISKIIGFGAEICAFVWGQKPKQITESEDYQFITGIGIETLFGHAAIESSDGTYPNYLVMECYSKRP